MIVRIDKTTGTVTEILNTNNITVDNDIIREVDYPSGTPLIYDATTDSVKLDIDEFVSEKIKYTDEITENYINTLFKYLNEDMSDISTEIQDKKTKILYVLSKYNISMTSDQLYLLIASINMGSTTVEDYINSISTNITDPDDITYLTKLLDRLAYISKLIYMKETMWDNVEEYQDNLKTITDETTLLSINYDSDIYKILSDTLTNFGIGE